MTVSMLVIGATGQVARSLAERAGRRSELRVQLVGRPDLDLLDESSIRRTLDKIAPDVVLNAAAYTAVDAAEDQQELAHRINGVAPGMLAREAAERGARLIHLSTDYVFDGAKETPYTENDSPAPLNAYGRSKLAGEQAVLATMTDAIILRTAWVFSPFGRNFARTMWSLGETEDSVRVVGDQYGSPTSALNLADALLRVVECWRREARLGLGETFHSAGAGDTSWAGFARAIMDESRKLRGRAARVEEITALEWPTKAARPRNSRLDCVRFERVFGCRMPHWRAAASEVTLRLWREQQPGPGRPQDASISGKRHGRCR